MASSAPASDIIEFCSLIGRLKHLKRTGWVKRGVQEPETVSGHMYRMAVLAFCLDSKNGDKSELDKVKCIKMALAHDMAECLVGDITPHCGVSVEEKFRLEEEGMKKLAFVAPSSEAGAEFLALWYEYEEQKTPEARAVKDLDKFDMIMQAAEYERDHKKPGSLQEFFDSFVRAFESETVKNWVEKLTIFRGIGDK